ncbi:efflux RND transporter periplasmic adaptor subunit [bacterium]|nr:efflux RND transporter periplasmic adaptor subunit [bacterium]
MIGTAQTRSGAAICLLAMMIGPAGASEVGAELPIRGVVRSLHSATLSTDLRAQVTAVNFREGERFAKGDILIEFDCRAQRARLSAASALRKEKAVNLKSARYLKGMKAGSTQDLEIAQAQVEQADAEIEAIAANLANCRIEAPYDGVVNETHVRPNEMPAEGAPVLSIVDPQSAEIELIVSSDRINQMVPGREFDFQIDETGLTHRAVIRRTAPVVDPASQTVKVYGEFLKQERLVLPGMSGGAAFDSNWALR